MKCNISTFIIKIPFNIKFIFISLFIYTISTILLWLCVTFLPIWYISKHTYITYLALAYLLLCIIRVILFVLIIIIHLIIEFYIGIVFNLFAMIIIDELYRLYITKTFTTTIRYILYCTLWLFSIILSALLVKRFEGGLFVWKPWFRLKLGRSIISIITLLIIPFNLV